MKTIATLVQYAVPALCAAAFALPAQADRLRAAGKPVAPETKSAMFAPAWRDAGFPRARVSGVRLHASAPKLAIDGADADDKRVRVGVRRDVGAEKAAQEGPARIDWVAAPGGGATARLAIASPGASSLRAALTVRGLPAGAELRFSGLGRVVGPVAGSVVEADAREQGIYWTPVTEGDTQTIEIWVPAGMEPSAIRVAIDSVSHLSLTPAQMLKSAGVGASQGCHEDVVCTAASNAPLSKAARSVAKMVFTENGSTYMCSGTLISDGDASSQVPYFYTAAHCIGSQAAATTLNTLWSFEATACGSRSTANFKQLTRGAKLLHANADTDVALLRLNERAPEGAWFSGWDATPLASGTPVVALHHPAGDLKKLSSGLAMGPVAGANGASYASAAWSFGSTEGGSSGSGLFSLSGGEYVLRGGLRGGSASCKSSGRMDDASNRDYYSRLDADAAALTYWLSGAIAPQDDYTGMWWNPGEAGWGLSLVQDAQNKVFITVYLYDAAGVPTWLVLPEGSWKTAAAVEGRLYRSKGSAIERYDAARFAAADVGMARIEFGHDDTATLTLQIDGRTVVKQVRRYGA